MKTWLNRRIEQSIALGRWVLGHWFVVLPVLAGYAWLQHGLFVNLTPSLPYTLVWLERGTVPGKGDLIVFEYAGEPVPGLGYMDGVRFFKRVAGLEGDRIIVRDQIVQVGEVVIGHAKTHTRDGQPLAPIAPGVIPKGYLFAQSDSPDSFDSRYASAGLVPMERVLGVAHPIF